MATEKIDLQTEEVLSLHGDRTYEVGYGYLVENGGVYVTLNALLVDVINANLLDAPRAGKWTHAEVDGSSIDFYYIEKDCVDGDCEHTFETDKTECDTPNTNYESLDYTRVSIWNN